MSRFNPVLKFDRTVRGGAEDLVATGSSAANQFFGLAAVTSNMNVVSTAVVASDSLIFLSLRNNSSVSSNGSDVPMFGVLSVSDGGFFLIGTVGSVSLVGSYTAMWEVKNPR